jgi:hypothetical protein
MRGKSSHCSQGRIPVRDFDYEPPMVVELGKYVELTHATRQGNDFDGTPSGTSILWHWV